MASRFRRPEWLAVVWVGDGRDLWCLLSYVDSCGDPAHKSSYPSVRSRVEAEPGEAVICDLGGRTSIAEEARGSQGLAIHLFEATRRAEEARRGGDL